MSTTGDRPQLSESERDAITVARRIDASEPAGADGRGKSGPPSDSPPNGHDGDVPGVTRRSLDVRPRSRTGGELSHAVSHHHWLNGLTALLGGYCLFLGGDALPKAVGVLGILGALAIWTALLDTRRSHRLRLILLVVSALPFAIATWWSVVTLIALLVLTIGPRAIRPTGANSHVPHRGSRPGSAPASAAHAS